MNICSMRIFYLKKTDLQNFSLYKKKKGRKKKEWFCLGLFKI